jgi:mannosyltransferase
MRSISIRLFLSCWLLYALHFATNTVREIYPALTLGEHLSFDVSEYLGFHPDLFRVPGRGAFINNNPGASLLGAIPYALSRPLIDAVRAYVERHRTAAIDPAPAQYRTIYPMAREFYRKARAQGLDVKFGLAAAVMQALCMAPLSALSVVVMFWILASLTASVRMGLALAFLYAVATPVFYRTAQLNQNLLVAHCALFAFAWLWRPWERGAAVPARNHVLPGVLCGWAVVCDYSGLIVLLVVGLYGLARWRALPPAARPAGAPVQFLGGVLLAGAVLLGYQWACFGNPFLPAQHYMPAARFTHMGYAGMDWPHLDLLWATAFDRRFGLFTSAPLLVLALYPPAWLQSHGRLLGSRETRYVAAFCVLFFLFCSANQYGRLQFNCGVRHVVPVAPFLFLLAAGVLLRLPPLLAIGVGIATAYWSWCLAMYRDVEQGAGVFESLVHVTLEGVRLPWLTTVERMGYVNGGGNLAALLLALYAVLVCVIWSVGAGGVGGLPARIDRRRVGLVALGGALLVWAAWVSNAAITQTLLGDAGGSLAWGPALFRTLLAGHGLALVGVGLGLGAATVRVGRPLPTRLPWAVLLTLSALALALRLWHLDSCLWFDEVLTLVDFARKPFGEIVTSFPSQNQHMLYSILAHVSLSLFGESAWALRLPSAVFGVASLWALFLLGRRTIGASEALLACALMTVSYHHIWFSQNARGYMALLFFALLATWLWIEALEHGSWAWWLAYVWAVSFGLWSHLTMIFVAAAHSLVYLFILFGRARTFEAGGRWRPLVAFLLCGSVTAQLYAFSLPEFLRSALHEVSLPSDWTNPLWVMAESARSLHVGFAGSAILLGGAGLLGIGWCSILRRHGQAAALMVLPAVLGGATMLALGHNLWPRFFFFSMGFALLAAMRGAMLLPCLLVSPSARHRRQDLLHGAGVLLACLLIVASAFTVPRCYALPKQDFTGARDFVERHRRPDDGVVAVGLAGIAYRRYFAPQWSVAQTAAELEGVRRGHGTVWLVYTLPIEVQVYRPEIWHTIENDFDIVQVFPGTLGGGALVVCRQRPTGVSVAPRVLRDRS